MISNISSVALLSTRYKLNTRNFQNVTVHHGDNVSVSQEARRKASLVASIENAKQAALSATDEQMHALDVEFALDNVQVLDEKFFQDLDKARSQHIDQTARIDIQLQQIRPEKVQAVQKKIIENSNYLNDNLEDALRILLNKLL